MCRCWRDICGAWYVLGCTSLVNRWRTACTGHFSCSRTDPLVRDVQQHVGETSTNHVRVLLQQIGKEITRNIISECKSSPLLPMWQVTKLCFNLKASGNVWKHHSHCACRIVNCVTFMEQVINLPSGHKVIYDIQVVEL